MVRGEIECYLLAFNDVLVAGAERRERILAEVEDHLRDAVESLMAAGSTAGEAELEAVARFGSPQEAAARLGSDPLGRAQQASRSWEARRIAHPVLIPLVIWTPLLAYTLWDFGLSTTQIMPLVLLWVQCKSNLHARRVAGLALGSGVIPRCSERLRRALADRPWIGRVLAVTLTGVYCSWVLLSLHPWFAVILGYYSVCGAAGYWSRLSWYEDHDTSAQRGRGWTVRYRSASAGLRYGSWALALAGPLALTQLAPLTANHLGYALLGLAVFVGISTPPTHRALQWLRGLRPAARFAARLTPLLTLLVINAIGEPALWSLALIVAMLGALMAIQWEIWHSRARSDATRRQLVDRTRAAAGDVTGR